MWVIQLGRTLTLNGAGVSIKLGTLREYLSNGTGTKRRATRQRRSRRTASATSGGH